MADVAHEWSEGFEIQSKQPKLRPELRGNDRSSVGTIEVPWERSKSEWTGWVDMSFDVTSPVDITLGDTISPELPTPLSEAASPEITPPILQPTTAASSKMSVNSSGRPVCVPTGSTVAAHIQDYERQMSQDQSPPKPTN
ncbi:hypothetical protein GGU11DRAFT_748226 [Lentinula aff. detonsa]|nr:hypothetical protein GGU11DRAFT_748226 [Lentinula aff. detonsa]